MAARRSDGRQITGNTRMPVRKATSSTAERLVGSTIARVRAPADRPIGNTSCLRVHHLLLGHEAEAHDDVGELVVGLLLLGEDHRELVRVDQPFAEDEVRETAADLPRALARAVAVAPIGRLIVAVLRGRSGARRVPVAALAVRGGVGGGSVGVARGGMSVAIAVRGRGDGRAGGWRFPGPFPVDAALEIHGRATRVQGGNQIDLTAGEPDVFDTYRTPWPVSRVIPDLAGNQMPGQELTAARRALARAHQRRRSSRKW